MSKRGPSGPVVAVLLGATLTTGGVSACTGAAPDPAVSATSASTSAPVTPSQTSSTPGPTSVAAGTDGASPPTRDGQTTPPTAPAPTYFSPTDTSSYALSGRIAVDQARQDPFSNLLKRGALHQQTVTLDVVGTPDRPVQPGPSVTVLFGTCRCDQRGSGLQVTVTDGSAVGVQPSGDVTIRGRFRPVVTASDAITLDPAP